MQNAAFHWPSPSGWSIYTSVGNTAADRLADCIAKAAAVHLSSMKLRGEWSDGDIDYEEGFYLLRHTLCPCVLTENGNYFLISACCRNENNLYICRVKGEFAEGMTTLTAK